MITAGGIRIGRVMRKVSQLLMAHCAILLLTVNVHAQENTRVCTITYISFEHVYLNSGSDDGIAPGDLAEVRRDGAVTAQLEVAFVAGHSSSCRILNKAGSIQDGDSVYVALRGVPRVPVSEDTTTSRSLRPPPLASPTSTTTQEKPASAITSGSVTMRSTLWNDGIDAGRNYTRSTVFLTLRARNISQRNLTFALQTYGRHNSRGRAYSSHLAGNDWQNNIYECSLTYGDDRTPIRLCVGRIIPQDAGTVGRLDGILIERNVSGGIQFGAFAGAEPQWAYSTGEVALRKYGGYVDVKRGTNLGGHLKATLGAAGEYHGSTVNRELIYSRTLISVGRRWSINTMLEFDINRGWRGDNAGEAVSLSSAYIIGRHRITDWLTGGISFDNRRNHWTYRTRSVADSLFDDNLRQGLRVTWDATVAPNLLGYGSVGYRKHSGDSQATYSYRAGIRRTRFVAQGTTLSLEGASFMGPHEHGQNASIRLTGRIGKRDLVTLGYNIYRYDTADGKLHRGNHSLELALNHRVASLVRLNGRYRYAAGDDTKGHHIEAGLSYAF